MTKWAPRIGILIFAILCFLIVTIFRFYHFGIHSENSTDLGFRINSEYSLTALRTWMNNGFWGHNMTISHQVTFPGVPDRAPYFSYPQGYLFLPYLLAKIAGLSRVTLSFVDFYSATLQFLIALTLGLFSWSILKGLSLFWAMAFSLTLVAFAVFSPPMVIFFQNSYFSDQASILPYLLFLTCFHFYSQSPSKNNRIALMILLFWGTWSDHSLVFLGGIALLLQLRFHAREKWKEILITFGLPIAASAFLFLVPVLMAERRWLYYFFYKFRARNGLFGEFPSPYGAQNYWDYFQWISDFSKFQGPLANALMSFNVAIGLIFFGWVLWKKWNQPILNLLILSTVPLLVHIFVFLQHYYLHSYNVVRTIIPLSLPLLAYFAYFLSLKRKSSLALAAITLVLMPLCFFSSIDQASSIYLKTRHLSPHIEKDFNLNTSTAWI
jgi:hypothetical protein